MKKIIALTLAIAAAATPMVANAQRTVTSAEKQRLIAEAKQHNQDLAERDRAIYASEDRLQAQLKDARAKNDAPRLAQLQEQLKAHGDQRERQKARNAAYQQHIQELYALKTKD